MATGPEVEQGGDFDWWELAAIGASFSVAFFAWKTSNGVLKKDATFRMLARYTSPDMAKARNDAWYLMEKHHSSKIPISTDRRSRVDELMAPTSDVEHFWADLRALHDAKMLDTKTAVALFSQPWRAWYPKLARIVYGGAEGAGDEERRSVLLAQSYNEYLDDEVLTVGKWLGWPLPTADKDEIRQAIVEATGARRRAAEVIRST